MMLSIIVLLQLLRSSSAGLGTSDSCLEVSFISRTDWNASEPIVERSNIYRGRFPLPYFFVHHTAWIYDAKDALSGMRQWEEVWKLHAIDKKWKDIGYNFLVDEAGNVYEGRGWRKVGAHTLGFNCNAFAVSVMGRYSQRLPGKKATDAIQKLIQCGVEEEHLHKDYILQGHRDSKCTATECPGERLYKEIKTWPHYPNRGDVCWKFSTIDRCNWGGKISSFKKMSNIAKPVPYIVIYHTDQICNERERFVNCSERMKEIRNLKGKIAYNFVIGGDANVYVGRGWDKSGDHAPDWNEKSYGITLIGDFTFTEPLPDMLSTLTHLIECGVSQGFIRSDYILLAHSDITTLATKCQGNAFKEVISKMAHYKKFPGNESTTEGSFHPPTPQFQKVYATSMEIFVIGFKRTLLK
ncbi:peptidoglycan recognition protein 4-like isoform X1 [Mya arenaria]|uniref:peptidoglycan recognition protein 4-like isoform X1 n=1 Tax=Mya arenaria TaxID=6604 RepID=UPI0022E78777|nr:peptidoglycan recognition protein 4-like isoform X1 [Mya arenaria]